MLQEEKRWVEIDKLQRILENNLAGFYSMHVMTLKKYLAQVTETE